MIPIVRTFISLPAGSARMPLGRFVLFTTAGCIPWVLMLAIIGREVGSRWEDWRGYLHYVDYVVIAAVRARDRLPHRQAAQGGGAVAESTPSA